MNELNIAKTLIVKRKEKGVTQEALARYIGVSKASVSKWETGQSYPDITFLPQLAAYFNITVDQLISYEPQMVMEDIRKLYFRLARSFTEKPFRAVREEIREITQKYFSCFPLLFHMGSLLLNHYAQAEEEERQSVVREACGLFARVKNESDDLALCKQTNLMEAACYINLARPAKVIALLEGAEAPTLDERNLLAAGYAMNNQPEQANMVLQTGIYQYLVAMLHNLLSLLRLEAADREKADEIIKRFLSIAEAFHLRRLHPTTLLSLYIVGAEIYTGRGDTERAFAMLQNYCDLAVGAAYPLVLKGDDFFNRIDGWLCALDLGVEAPLNQQSVKRSIVAAVAENPALTPLSGHFTYKNLIEKLKTSLLEE